MLHLLSTCVDHSRLLLILGLIAGVALPGLAASMAPYLPQMVAILLVLSAFRVGMKPAFGALRDLAWSLPAVAILQVGVPVALALALMAAGQAESPLALAVVLATAAPTLTGGASLAIVLRQDPARMMQLLVLGTAIFPATVLAVLSVFPIAETEVRLTEVGLRALGTIAAAALVGFALRQWLLPRPTRAQSKAVDGALVLFFALIVIGLMAALGPVLRDDPGTAVLWLIAAFALSFGLQTGTIALLYKSPLAHVAGPLALAAGNRNVALFLLALPPEIMSPIMVFVACWQVPMYLTPILLSRLYACVPAHE
jgi:ACR3 family arsenite transporter